ncbi:class I SAM-dependent methyltransferase [Marihabitans asiaticum]|uniref:Methyltransferase family protein n=1 Tax=Marihabitans asiaticum TaxID=415218 RepID=A0A560WE95_9MICO|nr:class I SAM-dependent methyltransferase [Marihabitans asiaticum]TWD15948.1 methyltransferase family protein [Marihabitans asiaticum]
MKEVDQSRLDAYWSERADAYDSGQRRVQRWDLDREMWTEIWRDVLPSPPAAVLDVGTGTGHVALMLAEAGYRVTGVDSSAGMLDVAARHAGTLATESGRRPHLLLGDAHAPPVAPGSQDAVVCRYLMWTLRDPVTALRAWRGLLRPGGVLALVDSTWFAGGHDESPESFVDTYGPVLSSLPLAEARSIDPTLEAVRAAGFEQVVSRPLHEVLEADRRTGAAPGHRPRLQHLVTARA